MTCRRPTTRRERDPQHHVSSPKIHRRSPPIHPSLPSHRRAAKVGWAARYAFIRGSRARAGATGCKLRGATISFVSASDAACPFFSVGKAGKIAAAAAAALAYRKKSGREIRFYRPLVSPRDATARSSRFIIRIYIYFRLVASSRCRREQRWIRYTGTLYTFFVVYSKRETRAQTVSPKVASENDTLARV